MTIENAAPHNITFAFRSNDAYAAVEPETTREEYEARLTQRGIARFIDTVIAVLLSIGAQLLVVAPLNHYGAFAGVVAICLAFLAPNSLEFVMTAFGGQSIGKRIAKIRVVRTADNGDAGLARSFLRAYVPTALFVLSSVVLVAFGVDPSVRLLLTMILNGTQLVLLWSERGRMLADRIAGTRVIESNPLGF